MKTALLSIGFIIASLLTLNSCGLGEAKTEAQDTAKIFHKHMRHNNHAAMLKMIHPEALTITPEEDWINIFEGLNQFGKIKKIAQDMSFNTNIENGETTVELNYTIEYPEETINEQITFRKDGETFKIMGYFVQAAK